MSHPYEIREYRATANDKHPRFLVVNTRFLTRSGQPMALTIYNTREDAQRCIDCWVRRIERDTMPEPMKRAIHKSRAFSFNR